jgi:flagellar basal-body rod protein FlgC
MFRALDISSSALTVQRTRMDVSAVNVASAEITRDKDGNLNPFRRRLAVLAPGISDTDDSPGVHVKSIDQDMSAFRKVFDPFHPDAGPDGNVLYPNIDYTTEMVNAMDASRAYEANVTAMEATKAMLNASLRLIG